MNIELSYMRYFFEVARQGSFMGASKTLKVSQPGISKIIKKLEDECGVVLFQRTKKGVILTEQGRLFLSSCERINEEVRDLSEEIQRRKKSFSSEIRFGASDNLCNYIVPEVVSRFTGIHPNVRMKIYSGRASEITREIMEGHVDFGMFYNRPSQRTLEISLVTQVRFSLVSSATKTVHQRTWKELPYIGLRTMHSDNPYMTLGLLRSIGITPERIHEVNHQESQKRFVLKGIGYAVLPTFMIQEELAAKRLREIPVSQPLLAPLYLVRKAGKDLSAAASEFLKSFEIEARRFGQSH